MSIMDELKRLAHPYEDEDDDELDGYEEEYEDEYEDEVEEPKVKKTFGSDKSFFGSSKTVKEQPKVVNFSASSNAQQQVVLFKPNTYDKVTEIADCLINKSTVVLNLENTERDTSRRLLDFLAGVAYAQRGNVHCVAEKTYIITPCNVEMVGDLIDELESNGKYF